MGLRRRHRKDGAMSAAADATVSREQAEAELERQKSLRDAEHLDTLMPLRRMRDKNHLAEMFIRTIEEGYRRSP
jgi:hypothetical protein